MNGWNFKQQNVNDVVWDCVDLYIIIIFSLLVNMNLYGRVVSWGLFLTSGKTRIDICYGTKWVDKQPSKNIGIVSRYAHYVGDPSKRGNGFGDSTIVIK